MTKIILYLTIITAFGLSGLLSLQPAQAQSCTGSATFYVTISNCPAPPLVVKAKAILQGPYNGSTMAITNNFRNIIPSQQPYNASPWNYNGTESITVLPSDAIDWVLLEVRDAQNNATVIEQRAALLMSTGEIRDTDGSTDGVNFYNLSDGQAYYLVVRHRNHIALISNNSITLPNATYFDFSVPANVMGGAGQLAALQGGIYGLNAGDWDGNGLIIVSDLNGYITESSIINQYRSADFQLNASVTVSDFNLYLPNSSKIGVSLIRY